MAFVKNGNKITQTSDKKAGKIVANANRRVSAGGSGG